MCLQYVENKRTVSYSPWVFVYIYFCSVKCQLYDLKILVLKDKVHAKYFGSTRSVHVQLSSGLHLPFMQIINYFQPSNQYEKRISDS